MDLNTFLKWQEEKPDSRSVEIKLNRGAVTIWVWDYDIMMGQHVTSVDEIDLDGTAERREKAELERLKKKYEGETK